MSQVPTSERPGQQPRQYEGLLTQVMSNTLDADYETVSARRTPDEPRRARPLWVVSVLVAFGIMLGVSALRTEQERSGAEAERAELVDQIHHRQDRLDAIYTDLNGLRKDVATLQESAAEAASDEGQLSARAEELGASTGTLTVSGPGISITADDAPDATPGSVGVIRDTDLRLLVNGLWEAGAEAVAINGARLTPLTRISYAGEAITVDRRSLAPPYIVQAIGDPDTLPARLLETSGGQHWSDLKIGFGVTFSVEEKPRIKLTGEPPERLYYAKVLGGQR
jgi:uncharacterized protein YlxW (UPF0749 family)